MVRNSNRARPRPRRQGPSLRIHSNGQYTIRLKRKDYYLGTDLEEAQRRRFEIRGRALLPLQRSPHRLGGGAVSSFSSASRSADKVNAIYFFAL